MSVPRPDPYRPLGLDHAVEIERAAAQEEVGGRAVGDGGTAGVQALQLRLLEPDAVAEHGARPAQAVVIVDVEIAAPVGEQLLDPGDLGLGLRDMRLHQAVAVLAPQRAGGRQLLRRTRSGVARRDGVEQPAAAVPFGDQRLRLVVARLRRVAQRLGRVAVHQHLAGGQPEAELLGLLEQHVDRMRMDGAVDAARGDAVAQVLAQEGAGDRCGHIPCRRISARRGRCTGSASRAAARRRPRSSASAGSGRGCR